AAMRPYLEANADIAVLGTARIGGRFLTDLMFRKALITTVAHRGSGATWVYRFSWPSGKFGFAEHCLDVPFFFDCLDSPVGIEALAGPNPPQALAQQVHGAAVSFISHGDPGWAQYTDPTRITRIYDVPSSLESDGYASVAPLL